MADIKQKIEGLLNNTDLSQGSLLNTIREWKYFWMSQHQNSQADYENYYRRAFGIDANMTHDLANRIYKTDYVTRLEAVVREVPALVKEIENLEKVIQDEFHERVCMVSMGCHCLQIENEALARLSSVVGE